MSTPETNALFAAATAYLVCMTATEGKYWDDETLQWAQTLMKGERRTGSQIVRAAIAQAEQPTPTLGLSILDAAQAIQSQANSAAVTLTMRLTLAAGTPDAPSVRTRIFAEVERGYKDTVVVSAETLPGIVGEVVSQFAK